MISSSVLKTGVHVQENSLRSASTGVWIDECKLSNCQYYLQKNFIKIYIHREKQSAPDAFIESGQK